MPRSLSNPLGCPNAKHQSPTIDLLARAMGACGQGPPSIIFNIPASDNSDPPRLIAFTLFPSGKTTVISLPRSSITWAAVRINPSGETMTPLPAPSIASTETTVSRTSDNCS